MIDNKNDLAIASRFSDLEEVQSYGKMSKDPSAHIAVHTTMHFLT